MSNWTAEIGAVKVFEILDFDLEVFDTSYSEVAESPVSSNWTKVIVTSSNWTKDDSL